MDIAPAVQFIFNSTFSNSTTPAITVGDGTHNIEAPVVLTGGLLVAAGGANPWMLSFGTASSITGTGPLTMNGPGGTLLLSGSDNYGGGTIVEAGTLILTKNTAVADGASLTVGAGGVFIFDPTLAAAGNAAAASPSGSALAAVPEPGTIILLSVGAALLLAYRRRYASSRARHG